ncbi:S-methyl-5-thioribose-1-phosphate isomerase [Tulasnella sp. 419]|nr:S-methyl-5-thioribose-1-phosphate isomerase [Tulasnella sp. 419]
MSEPLCSIRTDGDKIEIINQLLLPHVFEWIPINSPEDAHEAIKSMKIRGAPAIASLAALSISSHLTQALDLQATSTCVTFLSTPEALSEHLRLKLEYLFTARPTAVNLGAATRRLTKVLANAVESGKSVLEIAEAVIAEGRAIADEDVGRNVQMSKWGAEWLIEETLRRGGDASALNVLTVCNTGSLATSGAVSPCLVS